MPTSPLPGAPAPRIPIEVHGAIWCEDTSRARRMLRRLGLAHRYRDVDEDLEALEQATRLNDGVRRTPVITIGDAVLVEPSNDALADHLVQRRILTRTDIFERLTIQNVGDAERCLRASAGIALMAAASRAPRALRGVVRLLGGALLVSGTAGWCPVYQATAVSSLNGPGDRPDEAERATWLRPVTPPRRSRAAAAPGGSRVVESPSSASTSATPADASNPGPTAESMAD